MSKYQIRKSAYAVIPSPVLHHPELNDADKILYGHISNLCNENGYCWASNEYLANLTGKSIATIKRIIKNLNELLFIEISHCPKGYQDERQIRLSNFPKVIEIKRDEVVDGGGGSKMSHPQSGGWLKNEPGGGSKMSHIIYKEEYTNKKTTTRKDQVSSSFSKQERIEELEALGLNESQKAKIYEFATERILKGLLWLKTAKVKKDIGAALFVAIRDNYEPKIDIPETNRIYAKKRIGKYDERKVNGTLILIFRNGISFNKNGKVQEFLYSDVKFQDLLEKMCTALQI